MAKTPMSTSEAGKLGAAARQKKTTAEQRRRIAAAAGKARWDAVRRAKASK